MSCVFKTLEDDQLHINVNTPNHSDSYYQIHLVMRQLVGVVRETSEGRREGVVHMLIIYICEQCICMLQIIAPRTLELCTCMQIVC